MDWLKGIVGAPDRMIPAGQQPPPAWTPYGGAPPNAPVPPSPHAAPQPPGPPIGGAPIAPPPVATPSAGADPRVTALEAQCTELRRDVESLAVFARTLLTLLEERQITTPDQFAAMRAKIEASRT